MDRGAAPSRPHPGQLHPQPRSTGAPGAGPHPAHVIEQRADEVRRIQNLLEGANIKLGDVASDVMGVSARDMLRALASGQDDPGEIADLARTSLRRKRGELELALEGSVRAHQRSLLRYHLDHVDFLEEQVAQLSAEIEERMHPLTRPSTWSRAPRPGPAQRRERPVRDRRGHEQLPFRAPQQLLGQDLPGNNESAGKRRSGATSQGNPWLKTALVEAAWGASRSPNTYFGALYRRLARRRGKKRAIVAVAHALLVTIYYMLRNGTHYVDLGPDHFDELDRQAVVRRSVRRLEKLGYQVSIQPAA